MENKEKASKAATIKDLPSVSIDRMLTKYDFEAPEIQEKAYDCLKNILDGKKFGDIGKISDVAVVKVLEMVMNRISPPVTKKIIRTENSENDMRNVFDIESDVELK